MSLQNPRGQGRWGFVSFVVVFIGTKNSGKFSSANLIFVFMSVETNLQTPPVLGNDLMNSKSHKNFLHGL